MNIEPPWIKKNDLKLFSNLAKECLQKTSIKYKEDVSYDWLCYLKKAWDLSGMLESNDEESKEYLINYIQKCFYDLYQTILKLSHNDLKICISDIENIENIVFYAL